MKKNLSDYFVALSVIACSIVLLAALTFALSGYRLRKPARTLQIQYEDVTGIKVHSEVRYAGAPAGRVIGMRHLTGVERAKLPNKKDAVIVTVELDDGIPSLPTDVTATLSANTLVGTTDKSLQEQMKELHVILLNLKVVTTHAKALVDSLAEKPNRVIFSGKPPNLTPEDEIIKSSKPLPAKKP